MPQAPTPSPSSKKYPSFCWPRLHQFGRSMARIYQCLCVQSPADDWIPSIARICTCISSNHCRSHQHHACQEGVQRERGARQEHQTQQQHQQQQPASATAGSCKTAAHHAATWCGHGSEHRHRSRAPAAANASSLAGLAGASGSPWAAATCCTSRSHSASLCRWAGATDSRAAARPGSAGARGAMRLWAGAKPRP